MITRHRLTMLDLDAEALDGMDPVSRVQRIYETFLARVPYENLSNNRAVRACPDDPEQWPRATDRVLRENADHGLGGTSFSLAYCLRDLFRGARTNAHVALGYNLVTEQAHAAVLVYAGETPLLYDPALLMCGPVPVRPGGTLEDPLGRLQLVPRCGPTLTLTLALRPDLCTDRPRDEEAFPTAKEEGGERAVYSIIPTPAPPQSFRQAWIASFYRGRRLPLRFARRVGDRITRYGERPGCIESLGPDGREERDVPPRCADDLCETFGVSADCLREWYAACDEEDAA